MCKRKIVFLICLTFYFSLTSTFAEERLRELSEEAQKEAEAEIKTSPWLAGFEKSRKALEDKYGTTFAVLVNSQYQFIAHAKRDTGNSRAAWYYNMELDQRLWKGASAVFEIEGGHNKGIDKLLPTFSIFDENAGEPSYLYVSELYLTQKIFEDKIFLLAGRIDLSDWFDTNEVANSSDMQFQSSALGNSLTIPFPQQGLGAMVEIKPVDWFYFQAGASDAEASSTRVGISNCFKGTLFMAEAGFSPKIGELQGNYRFIYDLTHQGLDRIDDSGREINSSGFNLSFDQEVTKRIALFMRYGFADSRVRDIEYSWSCGGQITEPFQGRKNDVFGLGVAQSIVGRDYRLANESGAAETIYEAYYKISLHPFVKLIPSFQVVTHPLAQNDSGTDYVGGTRLVIIF